MLNPQINNPFQPYKDIHLNGTAVLFGSGPSLLQFDASRVPADVLRFGVNDQIFLDLDLDYWFMGDSVPQVPDKFWNRYSHFNDYLPKRQKFVRFCNWVDDRETIIQPYGRVPRNGQLPLNLKNAKYYVSDSGGNPDHCKFKKNIAEVKFESLNVRSYKKQSDVSLERKREIFGHLTQPVILPETKQKTYKVSPGQRFKDKNKKPEETNFQDMDKLFNKNIGGPQPFKPQERTSRTKDFIAQNVMKSQEKMNGVLEMIGDGKHAFDYAMNDYKKMGSG